MASVLIIEDESGIQMLLRRIVGMLGHEAVVVGDGPSALQFLKERQPALIISDLSLPGEPSGLPLIQALKTAAPNCPLVVATGYTTGERVAEIERLGVTQILHKPFDMVAARHLVLQLVGPAQPPA